jgi:hypothetical protein
MSTVAHMELLVPQATLARMEPQATRVSMEALELGQSERVLLPQGQLA